MKCSECNSEMSIDMKKVGTDKNNMPIFSKYAYCEHCKIMKKIEQEELQKKTNSILSVLSIVFTGVPMIMYMPIIVSVPMAFIGFILALVDLGIGDKSKKHIGSYFGIIFAILIFWVVKKM